MAGELLNNRIYIEEQFKKFCNNLIHNLTVVYEDEKDTEITNPFIIKALLKISVFGYDLITNSLRLESKKPIKDREVGKIFIVGENVLSFLKDDFVKYSRQMNLFTTLEKKEIERQFSKLIDSVTDELEITIKKLQISPIYEDGAKLKNENRGELKSGAFNKTIDAIRSLFNEYKLFKTDTL